MRPVQNLLGGVLAVPMPSMQGLRLCVWVRLHRTILRPPSCGRLSAGLLLSAGCRSSAALLLSGDTGVAGTVTADVAINDACIESGKEGIARLRGRFPAAAGGEVTIVIARAAE